MMSDIYLDPPKGSSIEVFSSAKTDLKRKKQPAKKKWVTSICHLQTKPSSKTFEPYMDCLRSLWAWPRPGSPGNRCGGSARLLRENWEKPASHPTWRPWLKSGERVLGVILREGLWRASNTWNPSLRHTKETVVRSLGPPNPILGIPNAACKKKTSKKTNEHLSHSHSIPQKNKPSARYPLFPSFPPRSLPSPSQVMKAPSKGDVSTGNLAISKAFRRGPETERRTATGRFSVGGSVEAKGKGKRSPWVFLLTKKTYCKVLFEKDMSPFGSKTTTTALPKGGTILCWM